MWIDCYAHLAMAVTSRTNNTYPGEWYWTAHLNYPDTQDQVHEYLISYHRCCLDFHPHLSWTICKATWYLWDESQLGKGPSMAANRNLSPGVQQGGLHKCIEPGCRLFQVRIVFPWGLLQFPSLPGLNPSWSNMGRYSPSCLGCISVLPSLDVMQVPCSSM